MKLKNDKIASRLLSLFTIINLFLFGCSHHNKLKPLIAYSTDKDGNNIRSEIFFSDTSLENYQTKVYKNDTLNVVFKVRNKLFEDTMFFYYKNGRIKRIKNYKKDSLQWSKDFLDK